MATSFGAWTPRRARQLWYAPVLAFATGLMMVRLLVLARLMDVPAFAELSGALLVSSTFVMLACLGLQSLLQRDMPVMFVRGREHAAQVLVLQCVLAACGCATIALVATGVWRPAAPGVSSDALAAGLVHGCAQQLFLVATVESRSRGEPLRFAFETLARSASVLGLGVACAVSGGSALWVVGIESIVAAIIALVLLRRSFRQAGPGAMALVRTAVRRWRRINWRSASILLTVSFVGFLLSYADRWGAASALPVDAFAHYAFAGTVLTIGSAAQGMLNAAVYPMLARLYARDGLQACHALSAKLSWICLGIGLVLAIPAYFALAAAIRAWWPAYAPAIALLPIFLAVAVLRMSEFWSSFMMIVGLEGPLLKTHLLAGGMAVAVWALFTRPWNVGGRSLESFGLLALAMTLSAFVAVALAARHSRLQAAA